MNTYHTPQHSIHMIIYCLQLIQRVMYNKKWGTRQKDE